MPRKVAQQQKTLSDIKWPFHTSRAIYAVTELPVHVNNGFFFSFSISFIFSFFGVVLLVGF